MKIRVNGQLVEDTRSTAEQQAERELYLQASKLKTQALSLLKLRYRPKIDEALKDWLDEKGCDKAIRLALNIVIAERKAARNKA